MSKVTFTIEDLPENKLKFVSDPSFETIMKMHLSGETLTPAHNMAVTCMRILHSESKKNEPTKLWVPKLEM